MTYLCMKFFYMATTVITSGGRSDSGTEKFPIFADGGLDHSNAEIR